MTTLTHCAAPVLLDPHVLCTHLQEENTENSSPSLSRCTSVLCNLSLIIFKHVKKLKKNFFKLSCTNICVCCVCMPVWCSKELCCLGNRSIPRCRGCSTFDSEYQCKSIVHHVAVCYSLIICTAVYLLWEVTFYKW